MDDLIRRFRDYQIEWLTAHNDIEFCDEEEKLIIGFLKDTAESFMRENQSAQPERKGKWLIIDGYRCSCCNYKLQTTGIPSSCPNCGADMRT